MKGQKTTIKINQGEEYRIRLGSVYEQDGFFYDAYQKGAEILNETLSVSAEIRKHPCRQETMSLLTGGEDIYEFPNNIIAFCGGRGEGKSSAMMTFARALGCLDVSHKAVDRQSVESFWGWETGSYSFIVLPVIDPTMMREQDSFMRIILSRMFAQLNSLLTQERPKESGMGWLGDCRIAPSQDLLQRTITEFRECYEYLDTLAKKPDIDNRNDDLDEIASLGDSGSLKNKFRQLVRDYLAVLSPGYGGVQESVYLVLQIDDADLNIRQTYEIMEDIRSFCQVPEVVILMAADMQQMKQIIEQHFAKDLEILLRYRTSGTDGLSFCMEDCHRMAVRYIAKVIPGSRQIYLPRIDSVLKNESSELSIRYLVSKDGKRLDMLAEKGAEGDDFQEILLRWTGRKTGIALVKPFTYRHNILPEHLRELTHFLAYFGRMEDLPDRYNLAKIHSLLSVSASEMPEGWEPEREGAVRALRIWLRNLQGLEQYFLNNWAELHLSLEGKEILRGLADAAYPLKHSIIVSVCDKLTGQPSGTGSSSEKPVDSYGYLMGRIYQASQESRREEDYGLLYAMRFYYMIFVYRRLLVQADSAIGYARLPEELGFATWLPDYRKMGETFPYGRFEVNIHALSRLREEFADTNRPEELFDRIYSMFYIVTGDGKARHVQSSDVSALMRDPAEGPSTNMRVMFDIGYFLLSLVCEDNGLYWLPDGKDEEENQDWETRADFADTVFQLLLNWDIQHYVEKNLPAQKKTPRGLVDLESWLFEFWDRLVAQMSDSACLDWIPAVKGIDSHGRNRYEELLRPMIPEGFPVILFGNEEYTRRVMKNYCARLIKRKKDLELSGTSFDARLKSLRSLINVIRLGRRDVFSCLPLKNAEVLRRKILEQWERIGEKLETDMSAAYDLIMEEDSQIEKDCLELVALFENNVNDEKLDDIFGIRRSKKRTAIKL